MPFLIRPHAAKVPTLLYYLEYASVRLARRPSKDVARYKDEILSRHRTAGWKQQEVVSWLAHNKDLTIDPRTLRGYLQQWDAPPLRGTTDDTEQLRNRIHFLFCEIGASNGDGLLKKEGFHIISKGLVWIRKGLGLKRLETSRDARRHLDEASGRLVAKAQDVGT